MNNPIRWRVVTCYCRLSPPLEVVAEGESDSLTPAEQKAAELRETTLGPECGVAVEWLYDVYGWKWNRHFYILTDSQREILAETEKRDRVALTKARSAAVEKKLADQKKRRRLKKLKYDELLPPAF